MMKRLILMAAFLATLLGPLVATGGHALAAELLDPVCRGTHAAERPAICKQGNPGQDPLVGPGGVLTTTVYILGIVVGVAAVIVIIISGLRMVLSAGDSNAISAARRSLVFAIVGLVVAAAAQFLVAFVLKNL